MPRRQEPSERGWVDRLDLATQPGQRASTEEPEDIGIAPLALGATRPELAPEDGTGGKEPFERVFDDAEWQAPPGCRLGRQERAVRPCEAGKQAVEGGAEGRGR